MAITKQHQETRDDNLTKTTDTGWAWVVAVAGMITVLLGAGIRLTLGILLVELKNVYDTSTMEVSLILTYSGVGICATALLMMFGLGDVVHERALLVVSGLFTSVGFIVTYFSRSVQDVYVLGLSTGAAEQIGFACSVVMVGKYFRKRLSTASSLVVAGISFGGLLFPPFNRWLYDEYTYKGAALIMAAISLNTLVTAALMRPQRVMLKRNINSENKPDSVRVKKDPITVPEAPDSSNSKVEAACGHTNPSFTMSLNSLRDVPGKNWYGPENSDKENRLKRNWVDICFESLKDFVVKDRNTTSKKNIREILAFSFTFFKTPEFVFYQLFIYFSSAGTEALLQFYPAFTTELGMGPYQSAFLLSLVGVADLCGKIIFGFLGDCNLMQRYKFVMIHQYIMCCACFLSRYATEFWSQVIFAIVIGVFYGTGFSFRPIMLVDLFGLPTLLRRAGISNFFYGAACASAGPLLGYIRDTTGNYNLPLQVTWAIFFASATSLLAVCLIRCCKETSRGNHQHTSEMDHI